jgi:hypothetical protein
LDWPAAAGYSMVLAPLPMARLWENSELITVTVAFLGHQNRDYHFASTFP